MDTIGKRIALIIDKKCDGNRSEFARTVKITPSYAAQLYADARYPSERVISDICENFNVNKRWLESGEGEVFNSVDREKEITQFFRKVSKHPDNELDEFKRSFISVLAKLDEGAWQVLRQMAKDLAAENDKKKEE